MAEITTSKFDAGFLTPEQAGPIFEKVEELSVVQRVAQRVELGPTGTSVPVFTGDVTASWVNEAQAKPTTEGGMALKVMQPKKIATIFVASAEVVRANPGNFLNLMRDKVAVAFARAFDAAALHGTGAPFDTYVDQTTKSVNLLADRDGDADNGVQQNVYLQLNAGLEALVADDKVLTSFLFDPKAEPLLNSAVDASGRPLFIESPYAETSNPVRPGRLLGRETYIGKGVTNAAGSIVGYGGDWSQAAWGVVGGISFDVSDQATVSLDNGATQTSLWQNNLIAVRAEAEYGFLVNDAEAFVQYTNA